MEFSLSLISCFFLLELNILRGKHSLYLSVERHSKNTVLHEEGAINYSPVSAPIFLSTWSSRWIFLSAAGLLFLYFVLAMVALPLEVLVGWEPVLVLRLWDPPTAPARPPFLQSLRPQLLLPALLRRVLLPLLGRLPLLDWVVVVVWARWITAPWWCGNHRQLFAWAYGIPLSLPASGSIAVVEGHMRLFVLRTGGEWPHALHVLEHG